MPKESFKTIRPTPPRKGKERAAVVRIEPGFVARRAASLASCPWNPATPGAKLEAWAAAHVEACRIVSGDIRLELPRPAAPPETIEDVVYRVDVLRWLCAFADEPPGVDSVAYVLGYASADVLYPGHGGVKEELHPALAMARCWVSAAFENRLKNRATCHGGLMFLAKTRLKWYENPPASQAGAQINVGLGAVLSALSDESPPPPASRDPATVAPVAPSSPIPAARAVVDVVAPDPQKP